MKYFLVSKHYETLYVHFYRNDAVDIDFHQRQSDFYFEITQPLYNNVRKEFGNALAVEDFYKVLDESLQTDPNRVPGDVFGGYVRSKTRYKKKPAKTDMIILYDRYGAQTHAAGVLMWGQEHVHPFEIRYDKTTRKYSSGKVIYETEDSTIINASNDDMENSIECEGEFHSEMKRMIRS